MAGFSTNNGFAKSPTHERILTAIQSLSADVEVAFLVEDGVIAVQSGNLPLHYCNLTCIESFAVDQLDGHVFKTALIHLLDQLSQHHEGHSVRLDDQYHLSGSQVGDFDSTSQYLVLLTRDDVDLGRIDKRNPDSQGLQPAHQSWSASCHESNTVNSPLIWEVGLDKGLTYLSQNVCAFVGRPVADLLGDGLLAHVHPDDVEQLVQRFMSGFDKRQTLKAQFRVRRLDGEYRWFMKLGVPRFDNHNQFVGYFGFCTDVTQSKQIESELSQTIEKVRTRDAFLAMLLHELRNPMTAITYSADFIESSGAMPDELKGFMEIILRQTNQMSLLLNGMLDASSANQNRIRLDKEVHDLRQELKCLIGSFAPMFKAKNQQLIVKLPDDPIVVNGDPARLKQAFTNLLDNASKYTNPYGTTWLMCEAKEDRVVVSVSDSGCGIPYQEQEHIFELFYQQPQLTHRQTGGMGIGLYLVKHIVEGHYGTITVKSDGLDQGCEFTVQLPLENTGVAPSPPDKVVMFENLKLAFVEDNEDTRLVMSHLLQQRGIEVFQFADGETASIEIPKVRPDVAIIDIGLPGKSGYDLAAELRQNEDLNHLVLIALSGYGQESDQLKAQESGFDDHAVKPTRVGTLCELIASHLNKVKESND